MKQFKYISYDKKGKEIETLYHGQAFSKEITVDGITDTFSFPANYLENATEEHLKRVNIKRIEEDIKSMEINDKNTIFDIWKVKASLSIHGFVDEIIIDKILTLSDPSRTIVCMFWKHSSTFDFNSTIEKKILNLLNISDKTIQSIIEHISIIDDTVIV